MIHFEICISASYLGMNYDFCPVEFSQTHGLERWWLCLKTLELLFHSSHRPQQHPRAEHPLEIKINILELPVSEKVWVKLKLPGVIYYTTVFKAMMYSLMTTSSWLELLTIITYLQVFIALLKGISTPVLQEDKWLL